tara:strand:+ start:667 stop:945 length:279 start_codon:yes stop_codon:yes gene_type:complete
VNIIGQIRRCTQDNGRRINYMVLVDMSGQMENNTKVILEIITKKDRGCSYGQMVKVMMVVGKIINNTVKLDSQTKKVKAKWACGRTEKESNG